MAGKSHKLITIPGDGIGQEIVPEALKVLFTIGKVDGIDFEVIPAEMGGVAYDKAIAEMSQREISGIDDWDDDKKTRLTLPQRTLEAMDYARDNNGAVLFGAVGRSDLPKRTAELALLAMRKRYGVVNNRPFIIDPTLAHNSILFRDPVDVPGFQIVSPEESLFGGIQGGNGYDEHWTRKQFTRSKLERTIKSAFELAKGTKRQIMCASKFNVLISEKLLSDVFEQVAKEYEGQVKLNPHTIWKDSRGVSRKFLEQYNKSEIIDMFINNKIPTGQLIIDNAGMQIASYPERYANTVVIADAMFGDFLQTIVNVVSGGKSVNQDALKEIKEKGINRTFIRELCGGLYFGPKSCPGKDPAFDTLHYDRPTLENLATVAQRVNKQQGFSKIDSLVVQGIPTFEFWKDVLNTHARENQYNLIHSNIKEGVERLLTDPASLGTVIASNMMGDIYTDLSAAVIGKSLGIMPSSAVNSDGFGIYEQIAGSAPDIAGTNTANPIAEIRSAAMMLEDLGYKESAQKVYSAIDKALKVVRTNDIMEPGYRQVSTTQMGKTIRDFIRESA